MTTNEELQAMADRWQQDVAQRIARRKRDDAIMTAVVLAVAVALLLLK